MSDQLNRLTTSVVFLCLICLMLSGVNCRKKGGSQNDDLKVQVIKTKSGIEMVSLPGGLFEMGGRKGSPDERPVHKVQLRPFLIDKYEVTQEMYERFPLPNPSHFKDPAHPMEQMTWADAAEYCNKRSIEEDLKPCYDLETSRCDFQADGYRLPTEAEWEYACRGGTSTTYSFGGDLRKLKDCAWYTENSSKKTHPVGKKKPNAWGIYDMHGSVAEWCHDYYGEDYYKNSPEKDPTGPDKGKERVLRGGAWNSSADACRSSYRSGDASINDTCQASDAIGFRCVRKISLESAPKKQEQSK
jgi:formylglycine-generating enzyme required for sulfatase activity